MVPNCCRTEKLRGHHCTCILSLCWEEVNLRFVCFRSKKKLMDAPPSFHNYPNILFKVEKNLKKHCHRYFVSTTSNLVFHFPPQRPVLRECVNPFSS